MYRKTVIALMAILFFFILPLTSINSHAAATATSGAAVGATPVAAMGATSGTASAVCDHNWNLIIIRDLYCDVSGYTEVYECAKCGEMRQDGYKAAGKHGGVVKYVTLPAACDAEGSVEYCCEICSKPLYTDTIPAAGHKWIYTVVDLYCDAAGYTSIKECAVCGYKENGEYKEAGKHGEEAGVVTVPATSGSSGLMTYYCVICGKELRTKTLPALIPRVDTGYTDVSKSTDVNRAVTGSISPLKPTSAVGADTDGADASGGVTGNTGGADAGGASSKNQKDTGTGGANPDNITASGAINPNDPAGTDAPFEDVGELDWYYGHVIFVRTMGLMKGTQTDPMLFSPDMGLTRGMLVTILYNMEGKPDVAGFKTPFTDVGKGAYYADAVRWAAPKEYIKGYGNGEFGPEDQLTRQDFLTILVRYADDTGLELARVNGYAGFGDESEISEYAKAAVIRCYTAGIIIGKTPDSFDPLGDVTRAETAAILHRLLTPPS